VQNTADLVLDCISTSHRVFALLYQFTKQLMKSTFSWQTLNAFLYLRWVGWFNDFPFNKSTKIGSCFQQKFYKFQHLKILISRT